MSIRFFLSVIYVFFFTNIKKKQEKRLVFASLVSLYLNYFTNALNALCAA